MISSTHPPLITGGLNSHTDYVVDNAIKSFIEKLNNRIEEEIKQNVIPPIMGKITPGKLKWRGIKRIVTPEFQWLEQRGKQITSKYGMKPNFAIDPAIIRNYNYTITVPIINFAKNEKPNP